jgi:hypothetical protein
VTLNRSQKDRNATQEAAVATRAKIHGRPLDLAKAIQKLYERGPQPGESRRAWGLVLAEKVRSLAATEVRTANFAGHIPDRLLFALERERGSAARQRLTSGHAA